MKIGDPITIADMSKRRAEVEWLGMAVLLANDKSDIWQVIEARTVGGHLRLTIRCNNEVREVSHKELIRMTLEVASGKFYRISPRWNAIKAVLRAPKLAQLKLQGRVKGTINAKQDALGRRWKGKTSINMTYTREN